MPSGRMIAWMIGLSLVTTVALEHYRSKGGAAPKVVAGLRRTA